MSRSNSAKLPFDDLAEEVAEDSPHSGHPSVEVVGGNEVLTDPDTGKLKVGIMKMLVEYINRCAAIDDELRSLGAKELREELAELKDKIKEIMVDGGPSLAYDETSNWEAALSKPRQSTEWDFGKLAKLLTSRQLKRYQITAFDMNLIQEGLKNGDLKLDVLESNGVVFKGPPGSRALYLRERKKGKK